MAGTLKYASHANFFSGMIRDVPRHLIPEGAVYDASNIVVTNSGSLAKRGASKAALLYRSTIAPAEMGAQQSANTDNRSFLYTAESLNGTLTFGNLPFSYLEQRINRYTSSIVGAGVSSPTTYGDSLVFGVNGVGVTAWCGGANFADSSSAYSASGLSITTVIGNNVLTVGAAQAAASAVGGYVHMGNGGTDEYTARIIAVAGSTITVDPAPTLARTYTTYAYYPVLPQVGTKNDGYYLGSVGCIGTFSSGGDSRIICGNVGITNAATGVTSYYPNRIVWSVREASDATIANVDGLVQATRAGFPNLNYIDVEDVGRILALVPIGSSNMLILGTNQCFLLSGQLLTQTAGVPNVSIGRGGLTASVRGFPQKIGCLSAKSVQRTPRGVMFAANNGVYITDGSTMVNTMANKISNYWKSQLTNAASANAGYFTFGSSVFSGPDVFAPSGSADAIFGSANINNTHYYVSMSTGGFICDLRNDFGWTRVPYGQLEITCSAQDADQTSNRVYAAKSGITSATEGYDRVMRLDPVVLPDATSFDADGSAVNASITTRAYTEGDPAQRRRFRHTLATYQLISGANTIPSFTLYPSVGLYPGGSTGAFTVSATENIDANGTTSVIGSTSGTSQTSSVDRYDHQTITNAVTYTVSVTDAPPAFQLYEITNAFNVLRPGRVI